MTATHHCRQCDKKTSHDVGVVDYGGLDRVDAIKCMVCGLVTEVEIHDERDEERERKT